MNLQLLISAVNAEPQKLIEKMKIESDAILINQCGKVDYQEINCGKYLIKAFSFNEKGVGLSRNNALMRADSDADIVLFSDEDIVYCKGYREKIIEEFESHPEADMLLFNVKVCDERYTYWTDKFGKVGLAKCGRYPAYSMAIRRKKLHDTAITFSLLFGGGAKYSNGEDSLFIRQLIKAGVKCYKTPVVIGEEIPRPSTWFSGYNEKFFFDRGVLYTYLYGWADKLMALQFIIRKKKIMCQDIPAKKAFDIMLDGIKEARGR